MNEFDRKKHWEHIYQTKSLNEVSWFESKPETSLDFFTQFQVLTTAKIIDIGGGDSLLVDHLLDWGYQDLTVLDISEAAIQRAQQRLGVRAAQVKWIVADAATFQPTARYDFWHDRAAFHFLTQDQEIENYLQTAQRSINPAGIMVIGTFSEQGPSECSGIAIKRYSETAMTNQLKRYFEKVKCIKVDHKTPFSTIQNFVFCSFRKV
ncbi:class I SAM-dependent methyltransferase [Sunxiuqinia sp. sy24]|uniref:class I SAM-dependent methyltransferase n=1 Tax=Sunxiuqinia sp. sy24 TaxID=3461495 RepID=UPI0040467FBC